MNILYISHDHNLSGASKSLLEIIDHFSIENKVYVLVPEKKGDFYNSLKSRNCTIICLPYYLWVVPKTRTWKWIIKKVRWYTLGLVVNYITAQKLTKIVKQEKIQVIHTNTGVCNIGALVRKKANIIHIWHIREFADMDFHMYPLPTKRQYRSTMLRNTDKFVFNSKAVQNHYKFIPKSQGIVIYNGVGKEYLISDNEKIVHMGVNFLISGRVSKSKGHDQALRACEILVNSGIKGFHLYVAGQLSEDIQASASIENFVSFLGMQKDMRGIRKNMDVELVCSRAEAFGRVTVEAMLAGNPVIGSNAGGTPEIINDGVNGLLYEDGNENDLANKMKYMIENEKSRTKMGKVARQEAKNKYMIETCVSNINELYRNEFNEHNK